MSQGGAGLDLPNSLSRTSRYSRERCSRDLGLIVLDALGWGESFELTQFGRWRMVIRFWDVLTFDLVNFEWGFGLLMTPSGV